METLFFLLAIGFALVMLFAMFKYANFIHHFPHREKSENKKTDKKPPEN